ncbi:MAG TPA: threonine--tRNA ligase, partial [bacterium]|nr:threonine--tRNA ligase [bacterium]
RVSIYRSGGFEDLCRGPHLKHTGQIGVFKLLSTAAAYWRGDERNPVLQRLYGTAFWNREDLDEYLENLERIKARDHRRLGRELDLYSVHEDVGAGLVFWHPRLAMVRHLVEEFWRQEHLRRGYGFVYTPHIAQEHIYQTSGHLENYAENMYSPLLIDEKPYYLKPMNCPGHIKIYQTRLRSYRDLPIRYCELGTVYRYERSGTLHGMLRVRGFTQDDAHVFCTPKQIADEVYGIIDLVDTLMTAFGYTYKIVLATRPEKYLGSDEEWDVATAALKEALERWGKPYEIEEGGGVFYAPKIDVKLHDALGREWQGPTIQVDLNLPKRFNVTYIGPDNTEHEVIMIHRAVLGSMERFIGGLVEHVGGAFPMWLAPTQVVVMPITDRQRGYAESVRDRLAASGFR